jgi:hypothetical protein
MNSRYGQLANFSLKATDLLLMWRPVGRIDQLRARPRHVRCQTTHLIFSTRIKGRRCLAGAGLLVIWAIVFSLQGVYRSHRLSALRDWLRSRAIFFATAALLDSRSIGTMAHVTILTAALGRRHRHAVNRHDASAVAAQSAPLAAARSQPEGIPDHGTGSRAEWFCQTGFTPRFGYRLVGYVDASPLQQQQLSRDRLGELQDLPLILNNEIIDEVFLALPIKSQYSQIESAITTLEEQGIPVHLLSDLFPHKLARSRAWEFEGTPLLSLHSAPTVTWKTEVKRLMDILASAALLILLFPPLLVVAVLIKLDSRGPVFFIQDRVGFNKRRFRMLKFRTMLRDAEARMKEIEHLNEKSGPIFKIRNDPRITCRSVTQDQQRELPHWQRHDMSIVGLPSPLRDALMMKKPVSAALA